MRSALLVLLCLLVAGCTRSRCCRYPLGVTMAAPTPAEEPAKAPKPAKAPTSALYRGEDGTRADLSAAAARWADVDLVAFGEVGLGGEVRQVAHTPRRFNEAGRLGFQRVVAPRNSPAPDSDDLRVLRVATLPEALAAAGLL